MGKRVKTAKVKAAKNTKPLRLILKEGKTKIVFRFVEGTATATRKMMQEKPRSDSPYVAKATPYRIHSVINVTGTCDDGAVVNAIIEAASRPRGGR